MVPLMSLRSLALESCNPFDKDAGFDIDDLYEEDPKFLELCPDNESESLNEGGLHSDESAMIS